jgi:putative transposase
VILDLFSRYCVGWTVQQRESAELAKELIAQAVEQQQIEPGQLTVQADRGSSRCAASRSRSCSPTWAC